MTITYFPRSQGHDLDLTDISDIPTPDLEPKLVKEGRVEMNQVIKLIKRPVVRF